MPPRRRRARFRLKNIFKKLKPGRAYFQFMYYDPIKEANRPLPDDIPVTLINCEDNGSTKSTETGFVTKGGSGKLTIPIDDTVDYIQVKIRFPDDELRYLNLTTRKLMTETEVNQELGTQGQKYFTKNMLFSLPRELNFTNAKWDITCDLFDAGNKYFSVPDNKPVKDDKGHAKLVLQPEWQFVSFRYLKPFAKDKKGFIPQGLMLEGFINNVKKVRSNLWKDKCQIIPWIEADNMLF